MPITDIFATHYNEGVEGPDDDMKKGSAGELTSSLRGKFLLAAPTLVQPEFTRTIVLIVRHDHDGALGVIVNRPLGVSVDEACSDEVEAARGVRVPLFLGGPCSGPLVAVHNIRELAGEEARLDEVDAMEDAMDYTTDPTSLEQPDAEEIAVTDNVWFCARREALEALMRYVEESFRSDGADEQVPNLAVKFVAGYAGWASGQLESELAEGAWQILDAGADEVFSGGDPNHPTPLPTMAMPAGAIGVLGLVTPGGGEVSSAFAAGIRQWVRLWTRASLGQLVDPRLIPDDPQLN